MWSEVLRGKIVLLSDRVEAVEKTAGRD